MSLLSGIVGWKMDEVMKDLYLAFIGRKSKMELRKTAKGYRFRYTPANEWYGDEWYIVTQPTTEFGHFVKRYVWSEDE